MASIRVYVKKKIEVTRMNFGQKSMLKMGTVGLAAIKDRVKRAIGPTDGPTKPLTRRYAIRKMRLRGTVQRLNEGGTGTVSTLSNRRDLHYTGSMMRNLTVRTVSENRVGMNWTSRIQRMKAANNQRLDRFIDFSPSNIRDVLGVCQKLVAELVPKLIKNKL